MMNRGVSGFAARALGVGLLAIMSGCSNLDVDMTSTPDKVRRGELVTFDIKLTNRSQCPIPRALAEVIAFIPSESFLSELSGDSLPADTPPEIVAFIQELRDFFDDLCSGGDPELPEPPIIGPGSCSRTEGAVECQISGPVPGRDGNSGSMTFASIGNTLQCQLDGATMSCRLRFPLAGAGSAQAAGGTGAVAVDMLTCLTAEQLGVVTSDVGEVGALCFLGTFPTNFTGLAPGGMATGQVSLPARGAGFVRNLVFGISVNDEDLGVCRGGTAAGDACDMSDSSPCAGGGTCAEGICDGGGNAGFGCDAATAMADCPGGGTCLLCNDFPDTPSLPVDCTTTYVAPEGVPAMSQWGLVGLAALLMGFGALWLQRRGRRA